MSTGRLEAFSDGVLAIIITIMVLELKPPAGAQLSNLLDRHTGLSLLTYVLSFVYVGIYWNNHHHLLAFCKRVSGPMMWANLHLLFWLSLYPFTTKWMDDKDLAPIPTAVYGVNLVAAAIAYFILQSTLTRQPVAGEHLRRALGSDLKGKVSPVLYLVGIGLVFVRPWLGLVPYFAVALMWLVPDRRLERFVAEEVGETGDLADR